MTTLLPELGCYLLAGQPRSARDLIGEVIDAETLGLGTAFISERYNKKEAASLCGAAAAVSTDIQICTAATNHNTRHPMVTAGMARTMQDLTGGRFTLGIGRGIAVLQGAVRNDEGQHRSDGGFRGIDAQALSRRGHHRARRTGRKVPRAAPRQRTRRAPADVRGGLRARDVETCGPLLRPRRPAYLFHRRDYPPVRDRL